MKKNIKIIDNVAGKKKNKNKKNCIKILDTITLPYICASEYYTILLINKIIVYVINRAFMHTTYIHMYINIRSSEIDTYIVHTRMQFI